MKVFRSIGGGVRASLFAKLAIVLAICLAVLMQAIITLSSRVTTHATWESLRAFAAATSTDFARKASDPVRFGDAEEVTRLASDFVELTSGQIEAIVVQSVDGTELVALGSFDDVSRGSLNGFVTGTEVGETHDYDSLRFLQMLPIRAGEDATLIGRVGIVWTAEAALANLRVQKFVIQGVAIGIFAAILIGMAVLIRHMITRPLGLIGEALRDVVRGDHDRAIPAVGRTDELGSLARDVQDTQERLREGKALQAEREAEQADRDAAREQQQRVVARLRTALEALSRKDLTHRIADTFGGDYEILRQNFNESVDALHAIVSAVAQSASSVELNAREISSATDSLAHRTETQAATLEETSAALEEITKSVQESAENAKSVEGIVVEARRQTDASDAVVRSAVDAMAEIKSSSDQISSIVSMIDDIAFQTNLLALNAGVEAARAGDAGRGFAVVANEVRSLAGRSAEAASEIKALIIGSAEQVERGVDLVNRTGLALEQVSQQVTRISGLVTDIAASSSEQAGGVSEVYAGVSQLDHFTQENAAMVEESSASGQMLLRQAGALAREIEAFRLDRGEHLTDHEDLGAAAARGSIAA